MSALLDARRAKPVEPGELRWLHPGDIAVAARGERVATLLGSCVGILLADPRRSMAGLCHVVNAGRARHGTPAPTAYGDNALEALFAALRQRGLEPRLCEVWLFGGGHLFPGRVSTMPLESHVGALNAQWALRALHRHGLVPRRTELGGFAWRRLAWTVGLGEPDVQAVSVRAEGAPS